MCDVVEIVCLHFRAMTVEKHQLSVLSMTRLRNVVMPVVMVLLMNVQCFPQAQKISGSFVLWFVKYIFYV